MKLVVYECPSCYELLAAPGWCPTCGTWAPQESQKTLETTPDNVMTLDGYYLDGSHPEDEE